MVTPSLIALIPARGGSKRIPRKNLRELAGHPLLWYTIDLAKRSQLFQEIMVSSEDREIRAYAEGEGARVVWRPRAFAQDASADIYWIRDAILRTQGKAEAYMILRPTSPCRSVSMLQRAWETFVRYPDADSLRAVEPARDHPGKMWVTQGSFIVPFLGLTLDGVPWHSQPTQTLPTLWRQNASLELAWAATLETSLAGVKVVPFHTLDYEGYDLNTQHEWDYLEYLCETGKILLPTP